MWKLKSIKNFLLSLAVLLCLASSVFAQDNSADLEEFQELAASLSMESFSAEKQQINSLMNLILEECRSSPELNMDKPYWKELEHYENLVRSEEYAQMPLSSQLRAMKNSMRNFAEMYQDILTQQTMLSNWQLNVLHFMNQLFEHMNKLSQITEKIIKSQNEDLAVALNDWNKALEDTNFLKTQLEINEKLAKQAQEEIAALKNMKKRLRTVSYIELGIGVPCLVLGLLPIWADEQQNIKSLLLGIGGTATSSGGVTFIFTISF